MSTDQMRNIDVTTIEARARRMRAEFIAGFFKRSRR